MQGKPTECPGDAGPGEPLFDGFSELAGFFRRMEVSLITPNIFVSGDFDLIHSDDGVERQKPVPFQRCFWGAFFGYAITRTNRQYKE